MDIVEELEGLYKQHKSRHILPFIGEAFRTHSPGQLRIAAVGINAYLNDTDWQTTERGHEVHDWFRSFWQEESHNFYKRGYSEVCAFGEALADSSLFTGLKFDRDGAKKPCLYATNAVKCFLPQELVDSTKLDPAMLAEHEHTWHRELDVMAKHGAFPHVIVVFGELIWEQMWRSFHREYSPQHEHFKVVDYETLPAGAPSFHHVNRLRIEPGGGESQWTLLVRVAHPSRPSAHNAAWLLAQPEFQTLAGLSSLA